VITVSISIRTPVGADYVEAVMAFPRHAASPASPDDRAFLDRLIAAARDLESREKHVSQAIVFDNVPFVAAPTGTLTRRLVEVCDRFRNSPLSHQVGMVRDLIMASAPTTECAMRLDRGFYNASLQYHRADVPARLKASLLTTLVHLLGFRVTPATALNPNALDGVEVAELTAFAWSYTSCTLL
jgi:hypothetical protein